MRSLSLLAVLSAVLCTATAHAAELRVAAGVSGEAQANAAGADLTRVGPSVAAELLVTPWFFLQAELDVGSVLGEHAADGYGVELRVGPGLRVCTSAGGWCGRFTLAAGLSQHDYESYGNDFAARSFVVQPALGVEMRLAPGLALVVSAEVSGHYAFTLEPGSTERYLGFEDRIGFGAGGRAGLAWTF